MNLTTTNYLFPTKEGRFQRWRRLSFCPPCGMGAAARCEGRCPSGAGRETWLLLPEVEGLRPHAPIGRALRPIPREFMQGWQPLHPPVGLPGPHPGFLSFHDERNQRRAGAAPLAPQCVVAALFALAALRFGSRRATFYHQPRSICHFEMGGRIGLFSPGGIAEGTPSAFKPWRGGRTNWRLAGVVITICSHRYDTFTVTNDQTLSPYLYYYHYLFYIKRVSFVTVSQQMAYLCGLLLILGVIPA